METRSHFINEQLNPPRIIRGNPHHCVSPSGFASRDRHAPMTFLPADRPQVPAAVRVTGTGPGEVDLEWDAPSSDGGSPVTHYIVQVRPATSPLADYSNAAVVDANAAADGSLSCHLAELVEGGEYYVRVFAENLAGVSESGAEVGEPIVAKTPISEYMFLSWNTKRL